MRLGAARKQARSAWRLLAIKVAKDSPTFSYRLDRDKLRQARRREGRYLLRTNLTDYDPARLWGLYLQLVSIEEAFRNLKGDLAIRPVFTGTRRASRRTSLSPFWPIASMSRSSGGSTRWPPA